GPERATARMADRAGLDLTMRAERAAPCRGGRRRRPLHAAPLVERDREALLRPRVGARPMLRPRDVIRSGSVTRLAGDAEIRPPRRIAIRVGIVVASHIRRVAVGADEVPVLARPRPVKRVAMIDRLVGIEVEPALPARRLRPRVPGDRERLLPAVGK